MKRPGFLTRLLMKALSAMVFPRDRLLNYLMPRTKFDYEKEVGEGMQSSVIMAPVLWICRRLAEAKLIIKKDEEIQDSHDILTLLKRPNLYYSGRLMRMSMGLSYNIDGNVYLLKIRNNQLKPVELWYVPHWMMNPHTPDSGNQYIDYYNYRPRGENIRVDPEDVIHIRFGIDPENIRKGLSPLKSLFREIFTDDEAANFSASLLRNMGIPGIILSPDQDKVVIGKDDSKLLKKAFKEKFGRDRRGEPLVMESKTKVEQLGFSPANMDLSRLRQVPEERVTAILGVPAAVVGFGTGLEQTKVGATMESMREAAYEDCIIPMQNLIAEELDVQLTPDFEPQPDRWKIDFDLSGVRVLQEDENKKSERIRGEMKDMVITQGEARQALGYEVRPEHDVYFLPFNIIPVGNISDQTMAGDDKSRKAQTKMTQIGRALIRTFTESEKRFTGIYERKYDALFNILGGEAKKLWLNLVAERGIEILSYEDVEKKGAELDEYYADLISEEINTDIIDYSPHYLRVGKDIFDNINAITGLGVNFTDQNEIKLIEDAKRRKSLLNLKDDTKKAVLKALADTKEAGEGPYQAAQKIKEMVAAGPWTTSRIRAKVIARTETKQAQNVASLDAYKQGGVDKVEIVDGQLPTSDEDCIERSGDIITLTEAYALDDHPNNTLSFIPVIGGTP